MAEKITVTWPPPADPAEAILYHINALLQAMRISTGFGRYRSMFKHSQMLFSLIWYAAIWEERQSVGIPIIKIPKVKL